ncbi:MAG: efflux RND transporter periplasmic adaptor subunit, partial [bacterium]|nr:efflux RND transporter periplasmic adaptor subunit [bacterium]
MKLIMKSTVYLVGFLKKRWYLVLLLLIILGGIYYWQYRIKDKEVIESFTLNRGPLIETLSLAGSIQAEEQVQLHFQTGGRLSWVGVKEGDIVEKYDGIASLDVRQLQKTLQQYLNTYSKERRDFEQTTDDNDELAIALSETIRHRAKRVLENSQFDLDNSVLDVELQSIAKEYSFLSTPIKGIVTRIDTSQAGMNVLATNIFEITNPDSLYMAISADQTEVVDLVKGQKGVIVFDAYPDEEVSGIIASIGFTPVSGESGTVYEVKMMFTPNSSFQYRVGMTGDVEFVLSQLPNVISIPD